MVMGKDDGLREAAILIYIFLIAMANNLVAGVPVTIPENLTRIDSAFVEGATVHLTGDQAEKMTDDHNRE